MSDASHYTYTWELKWILVFSGSPTHKHDTRGTWLLPLLFVSTVILRML